VDRRALPAPAFAAPATGAGEAPRYVRPILMKHRAAVLRALGPGDDEGYDLAFALGLLARDVTRVIADASRGLLSVFARHIPELLAAGSRTIALPAPPPAPREEAIAAD
jgi:hypothetical protein